MPRYIKKPIVIDSYKFSGNLEDPGFPEKWITSKHYFSNDGAFLFIETLEGTMQARKGDYIIKGIKGEFYPCKPDVFEDTYEQVDS